MTISYDTNNKVANSIVNMMRQSGLFKFEDEQYSIPEPETLEPYTMEEIESRIAKAEEAFAKGETISHKDMMSFMRNHISEFANRQKVTA